jgi:hypothetical protein
MTHQDDFGLDSPVSQLVRDAAPASFEDGFSERVLSRLRTTEEPSVTTALQRQFVRIVPLAAAASLLLGAYNWWGGRATHASAIEAALNLPSVSVSAAYASTSLYEVAGYSVDTP